MKVCVGRAMLAGSGLPYHSYVCLNVSGADSHSCIDTDTRSTRALLTSMGTVVPDAVYGNPHAAASPHPSMVMAPLMEPRPLAVTCQTTQFLHSFAIPNQNIILQAFANPKH